MYGIIPLRWSTILICSSLWQVSNQWIRSRPKYNNNHFLRRRSPSGFFLARLQKHYEYEEADEPGSFNAFDDDGSRKRDDVLSDEKCLQKCNNRLNVGMDMVNAHMAFGSIDVPSVMDSRDLRLFCLLDRQHSQCIDECGYSVQFNLREYVCKRRYQEMDSHLKCYSRAAPLLLRHCRPRCGGYKPLEHTVAGYARRCRQLLCDHACTGFILKRVCPYGEGDRAANFLLDFTKLQVDYWLSELPRSTRRSRSVVNSCQRLKCDNFQLNSCRRRRRRTYYNPYTNAYHYA